MGLLSAVVRHILKATTKIDGDEGGYYTDGWGGLHTASEPARAASVIDLTTTNATYTAPKTPRAIWVGTLGDVKVDMLDEDGDTVALTFVNVPDGTVLPVQGVTKVYKTGTSAEDLVALF